MKLMMILVGMVMMDKMTMMTMMIMMMTTMFSPSVSTALSLSGNFHCGQTPQLPFGHFDTSLLLSLPATDIRLKLHGK